MRVGVYIDAFNLYYGARAKCGRSTAGWRWLDVRALVQSIIVAKAATTPAWVGAQISNVVYCTAPVSSATNASGHHDQATYIAALQHYGSVDHVEFGNYVARVKTAPLATKGPRQ